VINDKSHSTAKHLSCDGLLYYKFITQFVGDRILNIGEHLVKLLHGKMVDFVTHPIRFTVYTFALKDAELAR